MMLQPVWLGDDPNDFPPTALALPDPNGLLAVGGDLSPQRLVAAYSRGIFPWFDDEQPILWWSPEPRMVFTPGAVHQSKSLKKHLRKHPCSVTIDRDFEAVIHHCRQPRQNQAGTWITDEMTEAYIALHRLGIAHSIETRDANGDLQGGFYGVGIGAVFFGESMFSLQSNASKIAITQFSNWAHEHGFALIDCQVENPHLATLGGELISRQRFETLLVEHAGPKLKPFQHLWQRQRGNTLFSNL
ncbi:MAG TPA: leucyl/phenylalanyl-tRNA--protein transferase [Marinagarivorans sp.]